MSDSTPINFIITPENRNEFLHFYFISLYYTDRGEPVPAVIFIRLFQLMYNQEEHKKDLLLEQAESCARIAVEKVRTMDDYAISWKPRTGPETDQVIVPDMEEVFTGMIFAFFLYKEDHPKAGKDEAIAFYNWAFEEYYKTLMEPNSLDKFTKYKQAVMSGVLAAATGFSPTGKTDPTNEEIYQATRNAIKKKYDD